VTCGCQPPGSWVWWKGEEGEEEERGSKKACTERSNRRSRYPRACGIPHSASVLVRNLPWPSWLRLARALRGRARTSEVAQIGGDVAREDGDGGGSCEDALRCDFLPWLSWTAVSPCGARFRSRTGVSPHLFTLPGCPLDTVETCSCFCLTHDTCHVARTARPTVPHGLAAGSPHGKDILSLGRWSTWPKGRPPIRFVAYRGRRDGRQSTSIRLWILRADRFVHSPPNVAPAATPTTRLGLYCHGRHCQCPL